MQEIQSHPVPRSALLFMAAVEEARRTNEGPFRAIAPLFRVALEHQRGRLLDVASTAASLTPVLGDAFSDHALEAFIPQLVSLGWLVEESAGAASAYRVPASLAPFGEEEALEASETKLSRLFESFISYLRLYAPLLTLTINEAEFKWELFRWATSLDGSDKDALKAEATRLIDGGRKSIKTAIFDEPSHFSQINKTLSVEFAGFAKWLTKSNQELLSDLSALTELGLALEFIEELRQPTIHMGDKTLTVLVLDAPVLLDLMGLSGPSRQTSIRTCLEILKARGARVATLTHSLEELSDILQTILRKPIHQRYGLTGDALRADPELAKRAQYIARSPDAEAKRFGVEIVMIDRSSPLNAGFFDSKLIDRFRLSATWHGPEKSEQKDRDALSIAYIMRKRQGRSHSDALDTPFILVTRNSTFTRYSSIFVSTNLNLPSYAFGPALETKTLAAITWMRFGSSADSDLPKLHLISACDRILASNGFLLRRAERKLKQSQSDDVTTAILSSQQAVFDLIVSTGGSPDVLDAANSEQLLMAVTSSAQEYGRIQERQLADKQLQVANMMVSEREAETAKAKEHALELATDKVVAEGIIRTKLEEIERARLQHEDRINETSDILFKRAERRSWFTIGSLWVAAAVYGVIGQFFIWDGLDWWQKNGTNFLLGATVIASTLLALALSLRFIPPGKLDLAASMHQSLTRRYLKALASGIAHIPDRNSVYDRLEACGRL